MPTSGRARYDALMDVIRDRMTVRAFDPAATVPREHYELILDAARHSPSGANAQPWHFIVVTEQALKTAEAAVADSRAAQRALRRFSLDRGRLARLDYFFPLFNPLTFIFEHTP